MKQAASWESLSFSCRTCILPSPFRAPHVCISRWWFKSLFKHTPVFYCCWCMILTVRVLNVFKIYAIHFFYVPSFAISCERCVIKMCNCAVFFPPQTHGKNVLYQGKCGTWRLQGEVWRDIPGWMKKELLLPSLFSLSCHPCELLWAIRFCWWCTRFICFFCAIDMQITILKLHKFNGKSLI